MKKILFALLLITMAFSQIDNTIAGWYNDNYYIPSGSVYSEGLIVADESTLAAETLDEVDFATHAEWDVTNDFDDSGGNAAFVWSANQTSTLTQVQGDMVIAGVSDRWYIFTYTLAITTAFDGDAAATITTSFALSAVSLEIATAGTYTIYFKSATTPTDFVISLVSGSDTEGTISYDDVTLKEIIGGNINVHGLFTGGGSTGLKIDSDGNARLPKALFLDEKATQETAVAGEGQLWVKDTAPSTAMFTDDDGDDHIITLGASDYGEMGNVYGSSADEVIASADQWYGMYATEITGSAPHLNQGFTFTAGKAGIIASCNTDAGDSVIVTDDAHGLLNGDYITMNGMSDVSYNGIYKVYSKTTNTFTIVETNTTSTETGFWQMGSYLKCATLGQYRGVWTSSFKQSDNAARTTKVVPYVNLTQSTKAADESYVINTNDIGKPRGNGFMNFAVDDRIWFAVQSSDPQTITFLVRNMSVHQK